MAKYIRCAIHGYIKISEMEEKLIDTQIFQRLRYVHQQGTAFYTYPGATHSRFEHSLGVMHLSEQLFNELYSKNPSYFENKKDDNIQLTRLIGLFHDIGHGPYSHVSDGILDHMLNDNQRREMSKLGITSSHELIAYRIMKDYLPQYLNKISNISSKTSEYISENAYRVYAGETIVEKNESISEYKQYGLCINNIIDSKADTDKMDFLMRDSHLIGLGTGTIDINRLMRTSDVDTNKHTIIYNRQAISTIEDLIIKRYQEYKWINFHHSVCFTDEIMNRLIWLGVKTNIFDEKLFTLDHFAEMCQFDLDNFNKRASNVMPEILDDRIIIAKLRAHDDNSDKRIQHYLDILERRKIYKPLWKVSSAFTNGEMTILKKLFYKLSEDYWDKHDYEDSYKKELEEKIEKKLKIDDVILSYKPYKPIKIQPDNTIFINTEQGIKPIEDISYIIKNMIGGDYYSSPPLHVPSYVYVPTKYSSSVSTLKTQLLAFIDKEIEYDK